MGTCLSSKLKIELFNINNAARWSSIKQPGVDSSTEIEDMLKFELALRTMRSAAQFVILWNYSILYLLRQISSILEIFLNRAEA
jgi:hypothetical protein